MRKLTISEMQKVCGGGRYGDSTEDYAWQEMSTGDYEWYVGNFLADVQSAVDRAVRDSGATTEQQAYDVANNYLNSVGLSGMVSTTPPPAEDGAIVVVGTRYDRPTFNFGTFDPFISVAGSLSSSYAYEVGETMLDADNVTIELHPDLGPLTPEQQALIDKLRTNYNQWVDYIKTLNPNALFVFPDGTSISAGDLVNAFRLGDFVIYPAGYNFNNGPTGTNSSLYGGGGANYNNGNPIFGVAIDQLANYMLNANMTAWYFTHELAHATAVGAARTAAMYGVNSPGGTAVTAEEFQANEAWADAFGRQIAQAAGYTFTNGFNGFYPGGPVPTYTTGSTGGTGDGGGTGGTGGGGGGGGGWENNNPIP